MSLSTPGNGNKTPMLNDAWYTVLKHTAAIVLPALTALYFALSQIWHFPDTSQVMASIAAINTCLGALVGYSSVSYNSSGAKYVGNLEVMDTGAKKTFSLALHGDPNEIDQMSEATFKVTPVSPPPPPETSHGAYIPPIGN
jgi:hypothetical protein